MSSRRWGKFGGIDFFSVFRRFLRVGEVGDRMIHLSHNSTTVHKQQNLIKTHKSQKKLWGLFLWGFLNLDEKQQKQARKQDVGLQNREKPLLLIPYDTGWNTNQRIFHVWRLAHDEHGESQGKDGGNTRGKHSINTKAITQMLDSRYKVEIHDPRSTTVIQIVFSRRRS